RWEAPSPTTATVTACSTSARLRLARSRRRSSRSGGPDDQDRAWGVMGDLVRNRSQQEPLGPGHPLVPDHDQVGSLLFGHVEDRVGGVTLARERLNLSDPGA